MVVSGWWSLDGGLWMVISGWWSLDGGLWMVVSGWLRRYRTSLCHSNIQTRVGGGGGGLGVRVSQSPYSVYDYSIVYSHI